MKVMCFYIFKSSFTATRDSYYCVNLSSTPQVPEAFHCFVGQQGLWSPECCIHSQLHRPLMWTDSVPKPCGQLHLETGFLWQGAWVRDLVTSRAHRKMPKRYRLVPPVYQGTPGRWQRGKPGSQPHDRCCAAERPPGGTSTGPHLTGPLGLSLRGP